MAYDPLMSLSYLSHSSLKALCRLTCCTNAQAPMVHDSWTMVTVDPSQHHTNSFCWWKTL